MAATVRSLEERIDDLADDFGQVKAQLAVQTARLDVLTQTVNGLQAQMQTVSTQLAAVVTSLAAATARLDSVSTKLGALVNDYSGFKAKSETSLALARWVGVFSAGVLVTVLVGAFTVVRSATTPEATVAQQQKVLDEIRRDLAETRQRPKPPTP